MELKSVGYPVFGDIALSSKLVRLQNLHPTNYTDITGHRFVRPIDPVLVLYPSAAIT